MEKTGASEPAVISAVRSLEEQGLVARFSICGKCRKEVCDCGSGLSRLTVYTVKLEQETEEFYKKRLQIKYNYDF